ncbi:MAG TPA: hypothetical protein VIJ40_01785 [Acidimicrobiales bacterium]
MADLIAELVIRAGPSTYRSTVLSPLTPGRMTSVLNRFCVLEELGVFRNTGSGLIVRYVPWSGFTSRFFAVRRYEDPHVGNGSIVGGAATANAGAKQSTARKETLAVELVLEAVATIGHPKNKATSPPQLASMIL